MKKSRHYNAKGSEITLSKNPTQNERVLFDALQDMYRTTVATSSIPCFNEDGALCTARFRRSEELDFTVFLGNRGVGRGKNHAKKDLIFRLVFTDRKIKRFLPYILTAMETHHIALIPGNI